MPTDCPESLNFFVCECFHDEQTYESSNLRAISFKNVEGGAETNSKCAYGGLMIIQNALIGPIRAN